MFQLPKFVALEQVIFKVHLHYHQYCTRTKMTSAQTTIDRLPQTYPALQCNLTVKGLISNAGRNHQNIRLSQHKTDRRTARHLLYKFDSFTQVPSYGCQTTESTQLHT